MINKPYLVRVSDNDIVNLENVTSIRRRENQVLIFLAGESNPAIILNGDEAKAMWIYFSSQMMSFQPLKITNPGQQSAPDTPN
ncbi:hypothetical protein IQ276_025915 [Desmonostoc muscorum LEGE 12446]|uniref:Uncharacterized protein n=1 Tax=Desmonostoc muscorum LEGE 12446 TaxID=1828758 RepID=A0A8J6ZW24_DESMC|nr:hypothetical protein [Desmonostoc muscorum]MCF2149801.1 hypothetical protein [Desmonostoc muscorum LEGE 12446]